MAMSKEISSALLFSHHNFEGTQLQIYGKRTYRDKNENFFSARKNVNFWREGWCEKKKQDSIKFSSIIGAPAVDLLQG